MYLYENDTKASEDKHQNSVCDVLGHHFSLCRWSLIYRNLLRGWGVFNSSFGFYANNFRGGYHTGFVSRVTNRNDQERFFNGFPTLGRGYRFSVRLRYDVLL